MSATDFVQQGIGLGAFERAVMISLADRIARAPSLEAKRFLSNAVWSTAMRIHDLRRLVPRECREDVSHSRPDSATEHCLDAWTAIPGEDAFLAAFTRVVTPLAERAYAALASHGAAPPAEAATRAFETIRHERAQAERRCRSDVDSDMRIVVDLAAEAQIGTGEEIPRDAGMRAAAELSQPARERAISGLRRGEAREDTWFVSSPAEHEQYLHQLISFEINAFEAVSRHMAEFKWMPWEFHWDMARQIRDELAHLDMWLERLPTIDGTLGRHPLDTHEFAVCTGHELPGRIALLERLIESSALDSLVLNRCLWESRQDATMVAYIDQVQIDEIAHVRQGNKWLRRLCANDRELTALVDDAEAMTRERALAAATDLENRGAVPSGNAELVRRKFDDPLLIEVNVAARTQAGFFPEEIAREVERRHRHRHP